LKKLVIYLAILASSCMNTFIRYEYADGSANLYLLTETSLEYLPVKPEESSTGMYSGGDPKKVAVTPAEFNELKDLFDDALKKTSSHIPDRIKTSGMISVIGSTKNQCILKPYCEEMKAIEGTLKKVLSK
jgi:hypothetical protein